MESCTGERGERQRRAAVVPYGHNFRPSATALPVTHIQQPADSECISLPMLVITSVSYSQ
jgi:hypothetical protein